MECKNEAEVISSGSEKKAANERLANYFRKATLTTLDKFLSSFSFSSYKSFYPEIYAKNPSHLKDIHEQLITQVKTSISEDLSDLCQQKKVFPSLQNLDQVILRSKDDKEQKSAWRPSGNPEEDIRDHMYEMNLKHTKRLEEILEALRAENKVLGDTVRENSKVILNIKKEIDDYNAHINDNFECIESSNIQAVEEELQSICEME